MILETVCYCGDCVLLWRLCYFGDCVLLWRLCYFGVLLWRMLFWRLTYCGDCVILETIILENVLFYRLCVIFFDCSFQILSQTFNGLWSTRVVVLYTEKYGTPNFDLIDKIRRWPHIATFDM